MRSNELLRIPFLLRCDLQIDDVDSARLLFGAMDREATSTANFLAEGSDFGFVHVREFTETCPHSKTQNGAFSRKADFAFQIAFVPKELPANLFDIFSPTHRNNVSLHNYSPRKITHLAPRKTSANCTTL